MKIGICTSPEMLAVAKGMGFDYAELNLSAVADLPEAEFDAVCASVRAAGLPVEAMNVLFPGYISLVGAEADAAATKAYLERAFVRAAALGVQVVVFGSGRARKRPDDVSEADARAALCAAAQMIGEAAKPHGIMVVIEPLNTGETNTINSVADGAALMREAAHPNVGLLADFYHMSLENEPMDNIAAAGVLMHTHIARGAKRTFPLTREEDDYEGFFRALKGIGYTGRMSIEGQADDFQTDAPAALAFLRALTAEAEL